MPSLDEHPTVRRFHAAATRPEPATVVDAAWLRQLCRDAGADDVGFVALERPELAEQRADIVRFFPHTQTLISVVCRMNRTPIRSLARSVANVEFHHAGEHVNAVAHRIVAALEAHGVRATNPAMGFPMEMERWSVSQTWVVAHKPVAVAAGLGQMGIHRNVIHPRFGNFILLGTVLLETTSALLQSWLGSARGGVQLTIYSLILMAVILWRPTGLIGLMTDAWRRIVPAGAKRERARADG